MKITEKKIPFCLNMMKPYDKFWVASNFHRSMYQTDKLGDKVYRDIISTSKVNFKNSLPVRSVDFPKKCWFIGIRFSFDLRVLSDIVSISFTVLHLFLLQPVA